MLSKSGGRVGRPKMDPMLKKVPVGCTLPRWLVLWLRTQDAPAARLIEDALRGQYGLEPPSTTPSA